MLGEQRIAPPAVREAAEMRSGVEMLQIGVESLAAQVHDFKLALEANGRLPTTEKQTLRRIVLLSLAKRHRDCIVLAEGNPSIASEKTPLFGYAMGLAILSAHLQIRGDLAKKWEDRLSSIALLASSLARSVSTRRQRVHKSALPR